MFPLWRGAITRRLARLSRASATLPFRVSAASLLACFHLIMFSCAGHERLDLPFNAKPDTAPYFSDPNARALTDPHRQPHFWSRLVVSRLDAQHYIGMATRGLTACPTDPDRAKPVEYLDCGLGWLPAYGAVGGLVSRATGLPEDVALVLLSVLATIIVNLLWTSATIVSRLGRFEAYAALIAFNCYPTAFQLVTPYTEAATVACLLGGFILIARDRWVLAALCVGASTALRPLAAAYTIAFGFAALAASWRKREAGERRWWRPLAAAPLAGWGQLATMFALHFAVGDAWAFFKAREAFGDSHDWARPFDAEYLVQSFNSQAMDGVIYFAMIAIVFAGVREALRKFGLVEILYLVVGGVVTAVLAIIAPLNWWGSDRYMMLFLIGFVCVAKLARRHVALFVLWIALCLAFYWHVELCNYISHGNPNICPCHGRMEIWMPLTPTS
jgi:hypothetical protein